MTYLQWLNANSAAIQAVSTVVLVVITSWYALRTHQLTSLTNEQLKLVRKAQSPDLHVSFCGALVPMTNGEVVEAFSVSGANRGILPVTVDAPFIQLPDRRTIVFPRGFFHSEVQFPCRLESGEGCTVLITAAEFRSSLQRAGYSGSVKIRAAYRDKLGTVFLSESFEATS